MRPLTFEEREELIRRSGGMDLLDFVSMLKGLQRKHRCSYRKVLAILLRRPQPTDAPEALRLRARSKLAAQGTEMTPDEFTETFEKMTCKLRNHLRDLGYTDIPDSDVELLERIHVRASD
jgi:hypothetical protein